MQAKSKVWKSRFEAERKQCRPEGYMLQGSVMRRYLHGGVGRNKKTYGPYCLWTRKIDGKTVTKALSKEQFRWVTVALQNNRRIEKRLTNLRTLSERMLLAITYGVPARNRDK